MEMLQRTMQILYQLVLPSYYVVSESEWVVWAYLHRPPAARFFRLHCRVIVSAIRYVLQLQRAGWGCALWTADFRFTATPPWAVFSFC
jgi:hypothetical protein